jgi:hypothetical protein
MRACWQCGGDRPDNRLVHVRIRNVETRLERATVLCPECFHLPGSVWRRHWALVRVTRREFRG